jgi:CRP/FNR family transcriptional regulator, anaerobic regulatory protein
MRSGVGLPGLPSTSVPLEPKWSPGPTGALPTAEHPSPMRAALLRGKQLLEDRFAKSPTFSVKTGHLVAEAKASPQSIYRLEIGWACQYNELPDCRRAIVDVYLPGDVIGLDALFRIRPLENALALTSLELSATDARGIVSDLLTSQCGALYVAWLLGRRQRRTDHLLTAFSCLDARGRMAVMLLDFHKRLLARRLTAGRTYTIPMTQQHIGEYLGLTDVHVNRVLRSLCTDGITRLERNCMTILDIERLRELGREGKTSNLGRAATNTTPAAA